MRKVFFILIFSLFSFQISAQEFKFERETIDYGKIEKGSEGTRTFVFTNIGKAPIIIKDIKTSCGCTIPEKPTKPIMPGETAEIKVSYDTKLLGRFSKVLTIFSNAKTKIKRIKVKGAVVKGFLPEKEKSLLSNSSF